MDKTKNTIEDSEAPTSKTSNYMVWYYIVYWSPVIYDEDIGVYTYKDNTWKWGPKYNVINEEWDKLGQEEFNKKFPDLLTSFQGFKKEELFVLKNKSAIIEMLSPDTCEHNFLRAIERFSKDEQDNIKKALELAKKIHEHQFRDEWLPYYVHCIAVAKDIVNQWWNYEDTVVSLLHDTIEDHPDKIQYETIKDIFWESIAKSISKLSKLRDGIKISNEQYYKEISEDTDNLKRKGYDRINNLRSLYYNPDQEKVKRYIQETETKLIPLFEEKFPDLATQMKEIIEFLNKKFPLNAMEKSKLEDLQKMNKLKNAMK